MILEEIDKGKIRFRKFWNTISKRVFYRFIEQTNAKHCAEGEQERGVIVANGLTAMMITAAMEREERGSFSSKTAEK